jgi:hypothetical protein
VRGGEPFVGTHLGAGGDGHAFMLDERFAFQDGAPLAKPQLKLPKTGCASGFPEPLVFSRPGLFSPSNFDKIG